METTELSIDWIMRATTAMRRNGSSLFQQLEDLDFADNLTKPNIKAQIPFLADLIKLEQQSETNPNIKAQIPFLADLIKLEQQSETKPNIKAPIPFLADLIKLEQQSEKSEENHSSEDWSSHVCKVESFCEGEIGLWKEWQPGLCEEDNKRQIKDENCAGIWSCITNSQDDVQEMESQCNVQHSQLMGQDTFSENLMDHTRNIEQIKEEMEDFEMIHDNLGNTTKIIENKNSDLYLISREQEISELREQRVNELREQGVNELREQEVNELREQGVNELREQRVNELREQRVNELREQGVNELREQGVNELREQRVNELREQRVNELREKGVNELREQRVNELREQRVNELREQRVNELREQGVNELREQGVNELREPVKVDTQTNISLNDGRLASGNGACEKLSENEFCDSTKDVKCDVRSEGSKNLYTCDVCGEGFTELISLDTHKMVDEETKSNKCNVKDKEFAEHEKIINRKGHAFGKHCKCDVCGKVFTCSSSLIVHKRTHTGEKPYKCDVCGNGFIKNSVLTIHKRTHTKEKPYKCDVCGREFADKTNLTVHSRTHMQEKPYKCYVCDRGFITNSKLAIHRRTHTQEKAYKCLW